eukprot:g1776.t1
MNKCHAIYICFLLCVVRTYATVEEETQERKFVSWLMKNGGKINNVQIGRNKFGHRGLYSKVGHKKGELLSITTANLILNNVYIKDFVPFNKYSYLVEEKIGGCGHLAFFLMFESTLNKFSTIQPYLNVLPKTVDLPGDWNHPLVVEAFSQLPSGFRTYKKEINERNQLLVYLKSFVFPKLISDFNTTEGELLESYLWARQITKSRAWGTLKIDANINSSDPGTCTLVPFADLYNHNFKQRPLSLIMLSNTFTSIGVTVGWGTTAAMEYKAGEEIFINYSTQDSFTCSFKAFLAFGIIPEKDLDPKHDCFTISINISTFVDARSKMASERVKLLNYFDFERDTNNFVDIELHGSTMDTFEEPTRREFSTFLISSIKSKDSNKST